MFATGGRRHGCRLEPCPFGWDTLYPLLYKIHTRRPISAWGPSATPGVLFVFKTPISAKKIQKYEILICKKSLFSLHKQNKEIPYKNSWFRNFFVRNSLFLGFLHQTGELRKHSHAREQERPGVGTCAPIPVLFVARGVINKFSQLSPGSLHCTGRNQQI